MGTVVKLERRFSSCKSLAKCLDLNGSSLAAESNYKLPNITIRDFYKFDRDTVKVPTTKLVTQTFKPAVLVHKNSQVLKIEYLLNINEIPLLLEEINSLLMVNSSAVSLIPDLNMIFIKCNRHLKLSSKPSFFKVKEKKQLSNMVQKLLKFYQFLSQKEMVNEVILENMIAVLVRNNRVIQAYNILSESPLRLSTVNLLNWEIKIAGDGIPETWNFTTGKTLNRDVNYSVPNSKRIGASDCIKLIQDSKLSPDLTTVNNLLLVTGKSGNWKLMNEIIEKTWKLEDDYDAPSLTVDSVLYPTSDTLICMIQSFAFNGQFMEGLNKMNKLTSQYKFKLNDEFWCKLLKILSVSMEKNDLKLVLFSKLWKMMEEYNKSPSWKLYEIKLLFLQEFFQISEMLKTLPHIYRIYQDEDPIYSRVILKQYLSAIIRIQSRKNLYNQSVKLIETWSPDKEFEKKMLHILQFHYGYYYQKMNEYMTRKNLSTELDDEDDSDFSVLA